MTHVVAGGFGTPEIDVGISNAPGGAGGGCACRGPCRLGQSAAAGRLLPDRLFHGRRTDVASRGDRLDDPAPRGGAAGLLVAEFCYGSAAVAGADGSSVRVRFRNTGGKTYARAEAHLVYKARGADATKVTFDWTDDSGPRRELHLFDRPSGDWKIATGRNVRTQWVEFEVSYSTMSRRQAVANS